MCMNATSTPKPRLPLRGSGHSDGPVLPSQVRRRLAPVDLDPILGPVLNARRNDPVRTVAHAVACRGRDASISASPTAIRLWLRFRGGPRFEAITSSYRSFAPTIRAADTKVSSASLLSARRRERLAVARRLVGHLLSPAPEDSTVSGRRVIRARHCLAVIALELLRSIDEQGYDTALVNARWLAVQMGCERRAAGAALRDAVALGWVRVVTRRPGGSVRVDLRRLAAAANSLAWAYAESVDALVDGRPETDPLAEVIAAAAHPAITYRPPVSSVRGDTTPNGGRLWLAAVLATGNQGIEPVTLGLPVRAARAELKTWMALLDDGGYADERVALRQALDQVATTTSAWQRRADAETARQAASDLRTTQVLAARESKAKAAKGLGRLLAAHPAPAGTAPVAIKRVWVDAMTGAITDRPPPGDVSEQLQRLLRTHLINRQGWPEEVARVVAAKIVDKTPIGASE